MEHYYYGVGRIRALESRLSTPAQIARMESAPDFESCFAVLSETSYAENLPSLKHPFDFEELYSLELAALQNIMEYLVPKNIIIQSLFKKNYQVIIRSTTSPLIMEMAEAKIDLANINSLLRSQYINRDRKQLEAQLLPSGLIAKEILLALLDRNPQEIIARLSFTPYFPAIAEGIDKFQSQPELLEKLMDNYILDHFKKAKYLSSGIEPLVGFILAKEMEIKTLRFILICKKNQIKSDMIRERVRINY